VTKDEVEGWFDPFVYRELHRTVKRLLTTGWGADQDRRDIFHELVARLIGKLPAYRPEKGHRYAFVTMVLDREASRMRRERAAKKRAPRRPKSLDQQVRGNGSATYADRVVHRDQGRRRGGRPRDDRDSVDLGLDVRQVTASLPADLQELAIRLTWQTVAEISNETEIPRSTLQDAVRQIRRRFERSDLQKYLEKRR
jgi:RNA polymerase sigma-70 factor, ECF subfamily